MNTRKSPVLSETIRKLRSIIMAYPGAQLPSVRNLSRQCGVSPVTVLRAIAVLKDEGIIKGRWGKGHFLAEEEGKPGEYSLKKQAVNTIQKTVQQIKNNIVEGIYQTHQPLPSVKQLTSYYDVSYPTIKKVLASLSEENIIKRSGAKYYFFTNQVKARTKIAVVAFGLGRNAVKIETERERNFYRILSTVAMDQNVVLEIVCCNDYLDETQFYTPDDTPFSHYLKCKDISGIILSSYHMKDSAECLKNLLPFNIPISAWVEDHRILKMIGRYNTDQKRLSFFDSSYSTLPGFEVGKYLIGKGHKNIAYISPFHESPWSQNRLAGLKKASLSNPEIQIFPYVCTEYLNDYFYLVKVLHESSFDKHCLISKIEEKLQPFLKSRIAAIRYEHDILLRDNRIFTVCEKLIKEALIDNSLTAWVCANDLVAVLITDYWNYSAVPLLERPVLVGFDNSFQSFERNITSYEFNTYGEVQHMLNHLLYPNSTCLISDKPAIRLSGRIVERTGCNAL